MASTSSSDGPPVTRDPRFKAGRTLVQTGRADEGAVDIFATLLEETLSKYGETSLEAAACYYEYGNALFRAARLVETEPDQAGVEAEEAQDSDSDKKPAAKESDEKDVESSESNGETKLETSVAQGNEGDIPAGDDEQEGEEEGSGVDDDVALALEMMETAWSVLDKHVQDKKDENDPPIHWVLDQVPRVLLGIGDVLTVLERYADAADTYSRALEHREAALRDIQKEDLTLNHLKRRRHVVEANVLVAEALLQCPEGDDVVTTETGDVLVTAPERVDYARGYYDKARDELQETVYLMGHIAASGQDLGTEKEDVCFLATLLMGVGTTLAEYDERKAEAEAEASAVHPSKRKKPNCG